MTNSSPEDPVDAEIGDEDERSEPATDEPAVPSALGQQLAAAAKRSGIGAVAGSEPLSGATLLKAMGGIRGLVETILPGLVFLVCYTFTNDVPISLGASVAVAVVFTIIRFATKTPPTQAVAGLIGVGASAILALITGRGSDNFVLGLVTNAGYALALLISLLVRWPLIGLAVGYLMGDGLAWRADRAKYRAMVLLTLCWLALFAVRLVVELPLYFANNIAGLAIVKLLMGVPLYAPLVLLSWLIVRSVYNLRQTASTQAEPKQ